MSVKIRMKKLGRKHRPFYRICAMDIRRPRNGKVLEELGTYDPSVPDTDARVVLKKERVSYWLGVGAKPSDKVSILIKKYGENGTRVKENEEARQRLNLPRPVPPAGEAVYIYQPKSKESAAETPASEGGVEAPAAE